MPRGEGSGKTTDEAVSDYNENANSGRWRDGVNQAVDDGNYDSGVAAFLGVSEAELNNDGEEMWESGVQRDSAGRKYDENTDGNDWLSAYEGWARGR